MNLANTSPKQLRRLSGLIAESDETLAEFLSSLQSTLLAFPLDKGAFRDELFMLGADLSNTGVLAAAGEARLAHVLALVPTEIVDVFLEGVTETFAKAVRREINITSHTAEKIAAPTSAFRYLDELASQGMEMNWLHRIWSHHQEVDHFMPKVVLPLFPFKEIEKNIRRQYRTSNKVRAALSSTARRVRFDRNEYLIIEDPKTGAVTSVSPETLEMLENIGLFNWTTSARSYDE
jgi:hypothetical protein